MYLFNDFYVKAYKGKNSKAQIEPSETSECDKRAIKMDDTGIIKSKRDKGKSSSESAKKKILNFDPEEITRNNEPLVLQKKEN